MSEMYKRRVRIIGHPDDATGYSVDVVDADTNEAIPGVACAVIYLNPAKVNEVELTCYVTNEAGHLITDADTGEVITKKVRVDCPEVDITAMERI